MSRTRPRRRQARPPRSGPPGRDRPARAPEGRPPARRPGPLAWWRRRSIPARLGLLAVVPLLALGAADVWLQLQPAQPDAAGLRADIRAGRSGAEVTFTGTVVSDPAYSGGHDRFDVRDQLGDTVELDYNTTLGNTPPVRRGDPITVHGQLYIDPGRVGVHCLHAHTSSGCPEPGWIRVGGVTYS